MSLDAGKVTGGIDWDISSYSKGMLQAVAIAKVFPEVVTAFLANPLLGLIDVAKLAFEGVEKAIEFGIEGAKRYAETVKEIATSDAEAAESAQSLGLSVDVFTGLSAAAKLAGSDVLSFTEGMKFLNRNVADAAYGNQDLRREFMELGISVVDATGHLRNSEDVFYDVADAISRLPNASLRTRFAMDLMGRGAEGMLPFLARGSQGMKDLAKEAERFGATTSKEAAESGEKFRHLSFDWDLLWQGIERRASEPAINLIAQNFGKIQDAMFGVSDKAAKAINQAFTWIEAHGPAIMAEINVGINAAWKEAEKAFDWFNSNKSEIFANLQTFGEDAKAIASAVREIGDAWVSARNSLADYYKDHLQTPEVNSFNALGNMVAKYARQSGTPLQHRFANLPFWGLDFSTGLKASTVWSLLTTRVHFPTQQEVQAAENHSPPSSSPISVNVNIDPTKTANAIAQAIKPELQRAMNAASNAAALQARQAAQRKGL